MDHIHLERHITGLAMTKKSLNFKSQREAHYPYSHSIPAIRFPFEITHNCSSSMKNWTYSTQIYETLLFSRKRSDLYSKLTLKKKSLRSGQTPKYLKMFVPLMIDVIKYQETYRHINLLICYYGGSYIKLINVFQLGSFAYKATKFINDLFNIFIELKEKNRKKEVKEEKPKKQIKSVWHSL